MADTIPAPAPAKPAVKVFHPFAATIPMGLRDEVLAEVAALAPPNADPARLAIAKDTVNRIAAEIFSDARGLQVAVEISAHKAVQVMIIVTPGLEKKS